MKLSGDTVDFFGLEGDNSGTPARRVRPRSLAISTPTKLLTLEEARGKVQGLGIPPDQKYIEVGMCSFRNSYNLCIQIKMHKCLKFYELLYLTKQVEVQQAYL